MKHLLAPNFQMKEQQPHGNIFFPCDYYACSIPDSFTFLPVHWHEEMEITLITNGSCRYQIEFESFQVREGDLLILPPRILHGISKSPALSMSSETFVFHLKFLGLGQPDVCSIQYLNPLDTHDLEIPYQIHREDPGHPALISVFSHLAEIYQKKEEGFELNMKAQLLLFVLALLRDTGKCREHQASPSEKSEKLRQVLDYIDNHYEEKISIPVLASISGFSEYHFMHFFKKYTHMTVTGYINQYRISAASRLLLETGQSITEIAFASGFHNISYFNRVFKDYFHMTPKEFRLNHKTELS